MAALVLSCVGLVAVGVMSWNVDRTRPDTTAISEPVTAKASGNLDPNMRLEMPGAYPTERALFQQRSSSSARPDEGQVVGGDGAKADGVTRLAYSDFLAQITQTRPEKVWLDDRDDLVLAQMETNGREVLLLTRYPADMEQELTQRFIENGILVEVTLPQDIQVGTQQGGQKGVPLWVVFVFLLVGVVLWSAQRRKLFDSGGAEGQAADGSVQAAGNVPSVRFSDVAGADEAVEDLREIVEFLRNPERYERTGAVVPKGALLVGPPGTGKTLLAKAVAGEAGVPFFSASGSDFVEMYVGVGARRIRDLFSKARAAGRAIVFIDEIDAVARSRSGAQNSDGSSERENTLNALLVEMDGFTTSGVIVLAATNRADILDTALTRPGRLDRKVQMPNPDRGGRRRILAVHTESKPLATDVDLEHVARRTPGMSGAELAQVVNEACLEAARRNLDRVDSRCFDAAIEVVAMGRARKSAQVTENDRRVTAWHEAGHTVCALLQPDADPPVSVSIIPRGHAGGITWMAEGDDAFLTRRKAKARLVTALGGRAAEEMLLDGEFTQGAAGDLDSATSLAMSMATRYGMTRLGLMVRDERTLAWGGMEHVNGVVEELLDDARAEARALLTQNLGLVEALVAALLEEETLNAAQIVQIRDRVGANRWKRSSTRHTPGRLEKEPRAVTANPQPDASAAEPKRATKRLPPPAEAVRGGRTGTAGRLVRASVRAAAGVLASRRRRRARS